MQFEVDRITFQGKWKLGSNEVSVRVQDKIGSGGFRVCHQVEVENIPPEYNFACSSAGWVAKFYPKERPQKETTWSLCRKVIVQSIFDCHSFGFCCCVYLSDTSGAFT